VLGRGLDEQKLISLASTVQFLLPTVKLAALGDLNDYEGHERWLTRGVNAYLPADVQPEKAIAILLLALNEGVVVLDESLLRPHVAVQRRLGLTLLERDNYLTKREREVLHFLKLGLRNLEVGDALNLKKSTVEFHVTNILSKLEARSRTEAVERARALGL
jgi:DNA-binding NarL/FixJ family response regulator